LAAPDPVSKSSVPFVDCSLFCLDGDAQFDVWLMIRCHVFVYCVCFSDVACPCAGGGAVSQYANLNEKIVGEKHTQRFPCACSGLCVRFSCCALSQEQLYFRFFHVCIIDDVFTQNRAKSCSARPLNPRWTSSAKVMLFLFFSIPFPGTVGIKRCAFSSHHCVAQNVCCHPPHYCAECVAVISAECSYINTNHRDFIGLQLLQVRQDVCLDLTPCPSCFL
jgi:hypothetical protein